MGQITDDHFPEQPELPRFRLIRKLSETRMSVVYLATEEAGGGRLVAVKVVTPRLATEDGFRDRFRQEMAPELGHANIVPVYSVHTEGEPLYLVMPYVDGPNLRDLLRSGPLDPVRTVHLAHSVASALDHAHTAGVVHRDVKPSNILVDRRTGQVLLCDFGIAAAGRRVGTPGYVAPELIPIDKAAPVDPRADVYSLGVVLYECLTGRPPHEHTDAAELLWAQLHEDPLAVTALRPDLPSTLNKVLATALAKRPRHRYGTCGALAEELANALAGGPVRRR
ncbi:serine/threonine-protein kinase [Actinophytocola sp.]|uniref:serine/threonine-protein kinase n=1 Tax=Actinophytocola sp. TaxID=1872138 RepID=UPI002ED00ED5